MAFPFQQNIAVSKSDSQQLSIMGFVLLDTPAALLLAFGREDPTAQPPNHLERHVAFAAQICSSTAGAQAQGRSIMKIGIIGAG
jgi:hypothetical protein